MEIEDAILKSMTKISLVMSESVRKGKRSIRTSTETCSEFIAQAQTVRDIQADQDM